MLILISVTWGCDKSDFLSSGDYFFLKNKGAVMPVWVRGNLSSDVILITVHGGPGGSGHELLLSDGFKELEKDYAIVYWDQRFSGLSQGDPDQSTLTIEQFVEDVLKVKRLIQYKYPSKKLFMLGHSWGGGLSAAFLGRSDDQSDFKGWIDVDGSVRDDIEEQEIKKWILDRVPQHYNEDPAFWQYIINWYEKNPYPLYSDPEPYIYISELGGFETVKREYPYSALIFKSPFSMAIYSNKFDQSMADGIDFTAELNSIKIPGLIIWGKEDGVLPDTLANYTFNQLATPLMNKEIFKIAGSAHSPFFDKPEEFSRSVKSFIENYK